MNSSTTADMLCGHCGRPIVGPFVWGSRAYHPECTHGPGWKQKYFSPAQERHEKELAQLEPATRRRIVALEAIRDLRMAPFDSFEAALERAKKIAADALNPLAP